MTSRNPESRPTRTALDSAARVDALAGELTELARSAPDRLGERVAALSVREQADLALRLPARERLTLLMHAPRPMRLVRALPVADLYLTVREIGPTDAMPLLRLASSSQIQHLLDLESWRKDRFDGDRAGAWVALLLEADESAIRRFLRNADDEHLALLFATWLRVEQLEYEDGADVRGHGLSESGTEHGFTTPDGYYRFSPTIAEHAAAIQRMLQMFYQEQPARYQRTLWSAIWELPSELEEQALHWRQSRLEEHGFPRWEESLSVYAPPIGAQGHPDPPRPSDPDGLAASRRPMMALSPRDGLHLALASLPPETRERVLFEWVSLANRLMVADELDTGEPEAHRAVVEKASGYVRIALEARQAETAATAAPVIEQVPVVELFREGYALAARLAEQARELRDTGWMGAHPRAIELLDRPVRERIDALLEGRPRYVEASEDQGVAEREFRTLAEIEETRVSLELAVVTGDLLVRRMGLDTESVLGASADAPTFSTLFLTSMAWHATRGELRGDALPAAVASDFLRTVASRRTAPADAPRRALEMLVRTLAERFGLSSRELSVLQSFGRYCLEHLSAQAGSLDPGVPVDPRGVSCLLVAE